MKNETPIQGHYDTSSVFVAVIGRPNVGKSSLTNLLVGEKVAIVTSKPQTTRTRITGVITRGPLQYVLLDTPGVHKPHNKLGKRMDKTASDSIADVDVSMMLFEPYGALNESEMVLVEALKKGGPAIAHALETNGAIDQSKQGIIAALADILTRLDVSAALTNEDVAGQNELTICTLGAQTLSRRITAVLGAAYALFMCHCNIPPT